MLPLSGTRIWVMCPIGVGVGVVVSLQWLLLAKITQSALISAASALVVGFGGTQSLSTPNKKAPTKNLFHRRFDLELYS